MRTRAADCNSGLPYDSSTGIARNRVPLTEVAEMLCQHAQRAKIYEVLAIQLTRGK